MKTLNEVLAEWRSVPLSASLKRCFFPIAEAVNRPLLHWNVQTSRTSRTFQTFQTSQTSQTSRTFRTSRTCSRSGFTVLELLVASLLLGMLVTMLTMIFNQSSIAWRTGISSVCRLEDTREQIGGYHDVTDDALPGIAQQNNQGIWDTGRRIEYRTVSVFRNWSGSGLPNNPSQQCTGRLIDKINWGSENLSQLNVGNVMQGRVINGLDSGRYASGRGGFVVGVRSAGPDRKWETDDDINTFPEDID